MHKRPDVDFDPTECKTITLTQINASCQGNTLLHMKKTISTLLLLLALVSLCQPASARKPGGGNSEAPTKGTFFMDLSTKSVTLQQTQDRETYVSGTAIGVAVSSWVPWQIRCIASTPVDEDGKTAEGIHMFMHPERNPQNPGHPYSGPNISMGQPKLVAQGQPVDPPLEVNRLRLGAHMTRPVPPGVYTGELLFFINPRDDRPIPGPPVRYTIRVQGYVELDVQPAPLSFVALAPGDVLSENTVVVRAKTNRRDLELQIVMTPLVNVRDTKLFVPQSVACLGVARRPRMAWRRAEHGRLGDYSVQVRLRPGENVFHVAGRLKISIDNPAGQYKGSLNVTAQPAWQ